MLLRKVFVRGAFVAVWSVAASTGCAPAHERIWIDDVYQNIFCGTSGGTRKQADGFVAVWRKMFARPAEPANQSGSYAGDLRPQRKCGNGEMVDIDRAGNAPVVASTPPASSRPELVQGNTAGFGLRDASTAERGR